ncbi:MAG TPA: hypothetical protein VK902_21900 [Rubrobacter sp.]|nr:hypothetical protein [Rubrobacter sp.]
METARNFVGDSLDNARVREESQVGSGLDREMDSATGVTPVTTADAKERIEGWISRGEEETCTPQVATASSSTPNARWSSSGDSKSREPIGGASR